MIATWQCHVMNKWCIFATLISDVECSGFNGTTNCDGQSRHFADLRKSNNKSSRQPDFTWIIIFFIWSSIVINQFYASKRPSIMQDHLNKNRNPLSCPVISFFLYKVHPCKMLCDRYVQVQEFQICWIQVAKHYNAVSVKSEFSAKG